MELADRILKYNFDVSLEWFRDNGFITWEKKTEEAYWRWFVDARIPLYFEALSKDKEEIKAAAEKVGLKTDWTHYTGLITYFPSVIHRISDSEYDLFVVSPRDPIITYRFGMQNPYVSEIAEVDPFTLNIIMNKQTAREKKIENGEIVCLENRWGDKVTGRVKVTMLIHPKVIAATGLGSWAKGRPLARGKGVNPNVLLRIDHDNMCPVSGTFEITGVAKVSKYTGGDQ